MALMHVNFFSDVLGMSMDMDVILPQQTKGQIGMEGKAESGQYKTMYLPGIFPPHVPKKRGYAGSRTFHGRLWRMEIRTSGQ